jgi:hypothetical protein
MISGWLVDRHESWADTGHLQTTSLPIPSRFKCCSRAPEHRVPLPIRLRSAILNPWPLLFRSHVVPAAPEKGNETRVALSAPTCGALSETTCPVRIQAIRLAFDRDSCLSHGIMHSKRFICTFWTRRNSAHIVCSPWSSGRGTSNRWDGEGVSKLDWQRVQMHSLGARAIERDDWSGTNALW